MDFFIDEDMAYLFGLITGRGIIKDSGGLKQIIISFPCKSLEATGVKKRFNQKDKILISLDNIVNRIGELVGEPPRKIPGETTVDIIIDSHKNSLLWRNVTAFTHKKKSFMDKEMADFNRSKYPNRKPKLCSPPKQIRKQKVSHPEEQSNRFPDELREKHFDTYWQVCKELGCVRYDKNKITLEGNEENDEI